MKFLGEHFDKQKNKAIRVYKGEECSGCKVQSACTRQRGGIRYIKVFPYEVERKAIREKMKTQRAKELYALRSRTMEPMFGDIKENKGMRGFLTRGLKKVRTEFNLACIASNLMKIKGHLKENNSNVPLKGTARLKYAKKIGMEPELQVCFGC